MLTQKELKHKLNYDETSGVFTWNNPYFKTLEGKRAGYLHNRDGNFRIKVNGKKYNDFHLAFLWMTGSLPTTHVDHKNLDRSDCSWENLRECTQAQNNANKKTYSKSGFKGVNIIELKDGTKKYVATITYNHKQQYLGTYDTPQRAHEKYCERASEVFGEFFNDGY